MRRNKKQPQITGPDVLMVMAKEARERGANPQVCDQVEDMLFRMFGATLDGPADARNAVIQAPMTDSEQCLSMIFGAATKWALDSGDQETLGEVVRVGTVVTHRFERFAEVT